MLCARVKAATEILARHGPFIRNVVASNVRDPNEIDEFCQRFYLSLVNHPIPKDKISRRYLYKAVVNDIRDADRQTSRLRRLITEAAEQPDRNDPPDPLERLIHREETARMFAMIRRQLHPRQAQAVILRHGYGLTTGQTAKTMGVSPRTISQFVSVGLKRLRELLSRESEHPEVKS
ncbi:MAG: sigma-70 family RNA polymerase sigma factor [Sedimentisphaerales bacterium]|nr:sigma-70 family RNA polymerase sigma factor [Sedimentisphaerales bacterium]